MLQKSSEESVENAVFIQFSELCSTSRTILKLNHGQSRKIKVGLGQNSERIHPPSTAIELPVI